MHKLRLTDSLEHMWKSLYEESDVPVPLEKNIDIDQLGTDWHDCYLVNIEEDGKVKYDFMGDNLISAFGEEYTKKTGGEANALLSISEHEVFKKFEEVISTRKTHEHDSEFTNEKNVIIKFRQILLPFSNDGHKVTHILGGMRWKTF